MPAGWMIGLRIRVPDRTCIIIRGIFSDIETIALHIETETATKGSRNSLEMRPVGRCVMRSNNRGRGSRNYALLSAVGGGGGRNNSSLGRRLLKRRAITAVDKRPL